MRQGSGGLGLGGYVATKLVEERATPAAQRLGDQPEPGPATSRSPRPPLPRDSGSTGAYLTAGITLTTVGGATRVTEVRKGGLINRRAEG